MFQRSAVLNRRTSALLHLTIWRPNPNLLPHQRAKAAQQTEDAVARRFGLTDGLQLHRPGFRRVTNAAALERTRQAYNDAEAADREAWRNPSTRLDYNEHTGSDPDRTGAGAPAKGSGAPAGAYPLIAGEGSACTVNGAPGVLQREGAWLVCKPRRSQDAAAFDAKQAAYLAYDEEMQNAWRGSNR